MSMDQGELAALSIMVKSEDLLLGGAPDSASAILSESTNLDGLVEPPSIWGLSPESKHRQTMLYLLTFAGLFALHTAKYLWTHSL